jgi:hypothetical protein
MAATMTTAGAHMRLIELDGARYAVLTPDQAAAVAGERGGAALVAAAGETYRRILGGRCSCEAFALGGGQPCGHLRALQLAGGAGSISSGRDAAADHEAGAGDDVNASVDELGPIVWDALDVEGTGRLITFRPAEGPHRRHFVVLRTFRTGKAGVYAEAAHCRCGADWERTAAGAQMGDRTLASDRYDIQPVAERLPAASVLPSPVRLPVAPVGTRERERDII